MALYKHILLAVELSPESDHLIIQKTKEFIKQHQVQVTVIHVVEHYVNFGAAYAMPGGIEVEQELIKNAEKMLQEIGSELKIPSSHIIVKSGAAKHVIVDEAKAVGADLIVVGSHGRHGVRLLLGSTANAVLHAAECDVLAVRVRD